MVTVRKLLAELQELPEEVLDAEIRIIMQPVWPFEYSLSSNSGVLLMVGEEQTPIVYLAEGEQIGYASEDVLNALGWNE